MIDHTEQAIVEFTQSISTADLEPRTRAAARLRIIDSVGVAIAAMDAPPASALRNMAPRVSNGASLWGADFATTVDHAALTNGAMVRYLDMNDAYTMTSTAHPSDNLAGLIALAEMQGCTVAELLLAATVSYEVQCRFCDVVPFHQNGWDQAISGAPAAAMAAAKLLSLDSEQTRHALSMSITPNLPTYRTRSGTLSMWKGLAGPYGAMVGIHAAMMAAHGITGPEAPFDGDRGLWALTMGEVYDVPLPTCFTDHIFAIEQSDVKLFPVRNGCQLPVLVALELREKLAGHDIADVEIWTDTHFFGVAAEDPALWAPKTRESADHSLPFCVAAALLDGPIEIETFENERYLDADIRDVIGKSTIKFDPDFNAAAPATRSCRLIVTDTGGATHTVEHRLPPGDPRRLPDTALILKKAKSLAAREIGPDAAGALIDAVGGLPEDTPVAELMHLIPKT